MRTTRLELAGYLAWFASALMVSGAAPGLTFTAPVAVHEDFEAETSYPATPELDVFGASETTPWFDVPGVPTLTGSAARIAASPSDIREGVELDIDADAISTLEHDVGLRSRFSGLAFSGDGECRVLQALRMALDDAPLQGTTVATMLELRELGSFHQATLLLIEEQVGTATPDHLEIRSVPLTQEAAELLFLGADFTLDVEIDRAVAEANASIDIDGGPIFVTPALPLSYAHDSSLTKVMQFAQADLGSGTTIQIDLDQYTVFGVPYVYVPLFNIDVGTFWDHPPASYAAAGSAGQWNQLALGVNGLVDLAGFPTSTTADLDAESLGLIEANGGDTRDLLADWARDAIEWRVEFAALPDDGAARVTVYSMGSGAAGSGELEANGFTHASLPGVATPQLVEGDSFARIETLVAAGELTVAGTADPLAGEAHVSGIQIEGTVSLPEPGLGMMLGAGLLSLAAVRSRRSG